MKKHHKKLISNHRKTIESNIRFACTYLTRDYVRRGIDWYPDAKAQLLEYKLEHDSSLDYEMIAEITAVLSSNSRWNRNLNEVNYVLKYVNKHGSNIETNNILNNRFWHTESNYRKMWKCFNNKHVFSNTITDRKTAKKTYSFANNLKLDNRFVTLDTWMYKIIARNYNDWQALLQNNTLASINIYNAIEQIFINIAADYNLHGYELQAALWLIIQDEYKNIKDGIKKVPTKIYYSSWSKIDKSKISNTKNNYSYA